MQAGLGRSGRTVRPRTQCDLMFSFRVLAHCTHQARLMRHPLRLMHSYPRHLAIHFLFLILATLTQR